MVRRNTRRRNRRMRGGSNVSDAVNRQYSASCLKNQTNAFTGPKGVASIKGLTTVTQTGGGFEQPSAFPFKTAPITKASVGRSSCDQPFVTRAPQKGGRRTRRTRRARRGGGSGLPIVPTTPAWWPTLSGNNTYNLPSSDPRNSIITLLDGSRVDSQQPPFGPRQGLQSAPGKGKAPVTGLGTRVFSSRYGGGRVNSKGRKCKKCKHVHKKKSNCPHTKKTKKGKSKAAKKKSTKASPARQVAVKKAVKELMKACKKAEDNVDLNYMGNRFNCDTDINPKMWAALNGADAKRANLALKKVKSRTAVYKRAIKSGSMDEILGGF